MKVEKITGPDGTLYRQFICPGCSSAVMLPITGPKAWRYNGNDESPTFQPSILQTWQYDGKNNVCHSYVTAGKIQFLNDCTHALRGQTVELPEIENGDD